MKSEAFYTKVFDLLQLVGGAHASLREDFLFHHLKEDCHEFRFQGRLGFGGKYYSRENRVSCYSEDETADRVRLIAFLNAELAELGRLYG
jgi:hypothetical protein